MARETDSINSGVYEEKPYVVTVTPRVRTYREKAKKKRDYRPFKREGGHAQG